MGLLDDIVLRLSTQGVGSTSSTAAWRIYKRELGNPTVGTSSQAQAIAVIPTGGFPQDTHDYAKPTFQVLVRAGTTSSTGLEAKVDGVVTALNHFHGPLNSYEYVDIQVQGEPIYLGRDEGRWPVYSINFAAIKARST